MEHDVGSKRQLITAGQKKVFGGGRRSHIDTTPPVFEEDDPLDLGATPSFSPKSPTTILNTREEFSPPASPSFTRYAAGPAPHFPIQIPVVTSVVDVRSRITSPSSFRLSDRRGQAMSPRSAHARTAGLPRGVVGATAREERLVANVEQLKERVALLEAENVRISAESQKKTERLRASEVQYRELLGKFESNHDALKAAVEEIGRLRHAQRQLQGSLQGEVHESEQLRAGFLNLLRSAKQELHQVRLEVAHRERSKMY